MIFDTRFLKILQKIEERLPHLRELLNEARYFSVHTQGNSIIIALYNSEKAKIAEIRVEVDIYV